MKYVIGIDGGGTKTHGLLADENGVILASSERGPTNPNVIHRTVLSKTLGHLLQDLKQQVNDLFDQKTYIFAGIAGAGEASNQQEFKQILIELLPDTVYVDVYPDSINALYSGTFGEPGIVQISGTGSITYGINNELKHGRVGGWGYLFGDEGSGFDLGKQGITASLKAYDGRDRDTLLLEMLYNQFHVTSGHELIREIYSAPMPKDKIAPVSQVVFQAYKQNDRVAQAIVENTVNELKVNILTLYKKLFHHNERAKLVLCGGVFTDKTILPTLIEKELADHPLSVVIPEVPPAGGSLIGAYLSMNRHIDEELIENIKEIYRKSR
ncbi:hypothetical protein CFK37_11175 [Virgibacillus phasianinus]|uniref:ATPase BadF/BadG/BcrA/BcrD type domain-containing protein n=1 Tax=Virgibacillus phasianinus TaxID=2017483 RepID=A0A220U422_9BACI|nr:BadF/BadG/BcrA/BcrD ATPase family protein [Virgibacillus phasianinus]ASK62666.1 hypothetical protein CFK37_11175 [Virgibacillus phasianinus]